MLGLKNKISYSLTVYYIDFIFKCALSARLWPVCLTAFSIQWNSFQAVRKILCHVIYWLNTKCKIRIYPNAYGLRWIFIFWDSQIYTKLVWGGVITLKCCTRTICAVVIELSLQKYLIFHVSLDHIEIALKYQPYISGNVFQIVSQHTLTSPCRNIHVMWNVFLFRRYTLL